MGEGLVVIPEGLAQITIIYVNGCYLFSEEVKIMVKFSPDS